MNMENIKCKQCTGTMQKATKGEANMGAQLLGLVLFLAGLVLLFLFPIGTIVGILLMVSAAGAGYKQKKIWKCASCGYFFERA